ncbi:MAG: NADH-quinone oxidoreductase subunit C [Herpetosiphonaceae bacterium]|nr:NADH-quinone oxidoreductase subunit C [Herpetosiphonaceae bacterium]
MLAKGELRALLARDLPEALAPVGGHAASNGNGNGQTAAQGTNPDLAPKEPKAQTEPIDKAEPGAGREGGARPLLQEYDAVVNAQSIPQVAAYLRDQHGYEFLSNITAVDYLAQGLIEVVYHFFSLAGGGPQTVRVRVPREHPVIPTLTGEWPGANLQEREAFDMYGVQFPGHPYLRRIYMWDEFEGYPLRKDFPKTGDKYTHDTGGE